MTIYISILECTNIHVCIDVPHTRLRIPSLSSRYDGETPVEVAVVDLQMVRMASPGTDLSNFFYTSLDNHVRKPNVERFLKSYHAAFANAMAASGADMPFTLEELTHEYKRRLKYGLFFAIMDVPMILTDASDIPAGDDFVPKWRQKAKDTLPANPLIKPRFLSTFDEMMDENIIDWWRFENINI